MAEVYGKVGRPYWDDKPVAIVGGGTSLKGFDFEQLRGAHVLAIKGSMFDMPWADAGFGLDMPRYREWKDKLAALEGMRVYWAVPEDQLDAAGPPPAKNVTFLRRLVGENISLDPSEIYGGGTSGYGGMQIAFLKRSKEIVLFGFDYESPTYGTAEQIGEVRHNDQHYEKKRAQNAENWEMWANNFAMFVPYLAERGIKVWNACPASRINSLPKCTLEDGVAILHRQQKATG
jgi:hypothetical protein